MLIYTIQEKSTAIRMVHSGDRGSAEINNDRSTDFVISH